MANTLTKEKDNKIAETAMHQEIVATNQYDSHIKRATDPKLVKILKHNMKDEKDDHAFHLAMYRLGLPVPKKVKV